MKKLFFILILITSLLPELRAQTWAEWFNQKKTQKKYLAEQIAALKIYSGYLQKGYSIAQGGLSTISDFKSGEFNLHTDFFNALKAVNPKIKNYGKVAEIIAMQIEIIGQYKALKKKLAGTTGIHPQETQYIGQVFSRLLDQCGNTLDELIMVTTSGELEMKDDERIERIDKLHEEMTRDYTFCKSFSNEALILVVSREKEQNELQTSRTLNGIKN